MSSKTSAIGLKITFTLVLIFILSISSIWFANAWFGDIFWSATPEVQIDCWWKDCNIITWTEIIKDEVTGIEDERTLSEYIQGVVEMLLTFVSFIAVVYIIYAWFRILIWGWDEENLKKQKTTILYVAVWIIVMWLAYPITLFIIGILN